MDLPSTVKPPSFHRHDGVTVTPSPPIYIGGGRDGNVTVTTHRATQINFFAVAVVDAGTPVEKQNSLTAEKP